MSRQSAPCEYRRTASPRRRGGMTLIEIMMAILILSIGLLGVLASVPFGAVQMGKMVEKDYVTAAARNGQSILKMKRWLLPDQWCVAIDSTRVTADGSYFNGGSRWDDVVVRYLDAGGLNASTFVCPVMIDPLGFPEYPFGASGVNPRRAVIGSGVNDRIDFVFPFDETLRNIVPDGADYTVSGVIAEDAGKLDRLFHSVDDLTYELEANSTNRPILLEDTETSGAAFTGEYSWMAMLSPSAVGSETSTLVTSGTPHYEPVPLQFPSENPEAVVDVRSDVVVFRGRIPGDGFDYITADVAVGVTGFAGGAMTLVPIANDCYRCAGDDFGDVPVPDSALSTATASDLLANLQSSAYLLLIGPKDDNGTGVARPFCRWYKIANSTASVYNDLDAVDVTLIGENCPENWGNTTGRVKAVVFKNVRGVLSQTTRLTGETVAGN
ncbi:MAG: prepilin-type N-terminal cleavage/methylation domain-containing protein [Thermoguttaceae bacterium]|nr:prepilin-type N-terminal cleavage/methylation domain-containing protein [Thermoguttaceae bacterium]